MQTDNTDPWHLRKAGFSKWLERLHSPEEVNKRFWNKVIKGTDTQCWIWTGTTSKRNGHGIFYPRGKATIASRFSYELAHGPIPEGLEVCHKCDNPPCVNPAHLFLGTHKQNMEDMANKGRAATQRGENNHKAKLTEDDVRSIRHMYSPGVISLNRVANEFGVSKRTILFIVQGKTWTHVK